MKQIFFLIAWLSMICAAQAQQPMVDIIFLKNGDQVAGEITHYEQGKKVVLRRTDGVEVEFNDADILKIMQGVHKTAENVAPVAKQTEAFTLKTSGVYNNTNVAFGLGDGGNGNGLAISAGLHNVIGYQLSPAFGAGIGFGLDSYSRRGETVFPVYADLRSYLPHKKKPLSYYIGASAGWGFAFKRDKLDISDAKGGWMAHGFIGYRTATKEGTDVTMDVGLKFQKAFFAHDLSNGDVEERDLVFRRFTVRIGLSLWK